MIKKKKWKKERRRIGEEIEGERKKQGKRKGKERNSEYWRNLNSSFQIIFFYFDIIENKILV